MNTLDQKLKTAKRSSRAKLMFGVLGGVLLFAVVLPLFYFSHIVFFRITPLLAAKHAVVSVSDGVGVALFDAAYVLGNRAILRFESPGFIHREVTIDFSRDNGDLLVEMREAPAKVVITTDPSLAQTRWRVNGADIAIGEQFSREVQSGILNIEVDHEFYMPQTLEVEAQKGKEFVRHVRLAPLSGSIRIHSEPAGARVLINGEEKGLTPISTAMPGGLHRVRVTLDGYQDVDEEIAVTNSSMKIKRDYRLKVQQASVRIAASPAGGVLLVNGRSAKTGTSSVSLAAGRKHTLKYEKPGYVSQSREVALKKNEQVKVKFQLEKEIGEVVIRSNPPADILINGKSVGATPRTLHLQALPQKITLRQDGYRSVTLSVTPTAGAPLLVDKKLTREFTARLAEAKPVITTAAGVKMKFFHPRVRSQNRFTMGAPREERDRRANEFEREVDLTKPFYTSTAEITEGQFAKYKPGTGAGKKLPVRNVSWLDAVAFCNWMSKQDGLQPVYDIAGGKLRGFDATADGYRLLSEAEWEWLARVAERRGTARFVWGNDTTIPPKSGNIADESAKGSVTKYIPRYDDGFAGVAPAASFPPDAAGLYDMAGNVSEWVHDIYSLQPPKPGLVETNPFGGAHGDGRVIKGSSFRSATVTSLRSSFREGLLRARDDVGFRVARYLYGKE